MRRAFPFGMFTLHDHQHHRVSTLPDQGAQLSRTVPVETPPLPAEYPSNILPFPRNRGRIPVDPPWLRPEIYR